MKSFQKKSGWGNIMQSKPVLVLLIVLLLFFAWSVVELMAKLEATAQNREIAEKKVALLEEKKEKLSSDIARLSTPGGVEETIRDKYGLAKEGEGMIVVVDEKSDKQKTADSGSSSFFSPLFFWRNWFK